MAPFDTTFSDNATKVLFVTYFRGGSTLVGELFNRNPEAFYWFEPLAGLMESNKTQQSKYHFPNEEAFSIGDDNETVA